MIILHIQELNVYTIIFNENRLLLLKRKDNLWEFPGGGIEWGETPHEAAIRETKEETGISIKNLELIGVTSATYKKGSNEKHAIYIVYKAIADNNDVVISQEHAEHVWLSLNELKFLKLGLNAEQAIDLIK